MPYKSATSLPKSVRDSLPGHARQIYMKAYNSAWKQYDQPGERRGGASRQETAARVAWAAVKKKYKKNEKTGKWKEK